MRSSIIGLLSLPFLLLRQALPASAEPEVLLPLKSWDENAEWPAKRAAGYSENLDLRNDEHIMWGNPGNGSTFMYANMTMHTATGELVISMDRFAHLLTNVKCGESTVLTFKDKPSFEYAIRAWNWVNEDETHSFILIADYAGCGPDNVRVPFYIHNADYDEEKFIAYLYGKQVPWKQAAHTFEMDWGTATLIPGAGHLSKRIGKDVSYSKDIDVPIAHDLTGNIYNSKANGVLVKLDCTDCGLKGKLVLSGRIKVDFTSIAELSVSLTPKDVATSVALSLHAEGKSTTKIAWQPPLKPIGIPGASFKIPGPGDDVVDIGIFVKANFGFEIGKWEGEATMTYGITAAIPNTSHFKLDLAHLNKPVDSAGWKPSFTQKPFGLNAKSSIEASIYTALGIAAEFKVLGKGYEIALTLKAPELATKITTLTNTKGVCGTKEKVGVSVDADLKASVEVSAGLDGTGQGEDINISPRAVSARERRRISQPQNEVSGVELASRTVAGSNNVAERNVPGLEFSKVLWEGKDPWLKEKCIAII